MARSLPADQLPKGMEVPKPPEPPAPLTLEQVNYVAEMRKAFANLPFEVHVEACNVHERYGDHPVVDMRFIIRPKEPGGFPE